MQQNHVNDPWQVLGIQRNTDADGIRAAYLNQVKLHPPEQEPEKFEVIRDAYRCLADPHQRDRAELLKTDPRQPLAELVPDKNIKRRFAGQLPWLEVIGEQA